MPSGKTHTWLNMILLAVAAFVVYKVQVFTVDATICMVGFLFGTLLLSPDLDLSYSSVTKRWGLLRILWFPYSLFFKHRGYSHHLIVGPISRLLYLILLCGIVFMVVPFSVPKLTYLLIFTGGVYIADVLHIVFDKIL